MRILYSGIDTLRLGTQIRFRPEVWAMFMRAYDVARADRSFRPKVVLGRVPHELRLPSKDDREAGWRFVLASAEWSITASRAAARDKDETTPNFMVTFRAEALAQHGPDALLELLEEMLANDGCVRQSSSWQVSRLDFCVDVEGLRMRPGWLPHFVSRASPGARREGHWGEGASLGRLAQGIGGEVGYQLGVRGRKGIMLRAYAKAVQSARKSSAAWIRGLWFAQSDWDGCSPVTRFEFELGREPLVTLGCGHYLALMSGDRLRQLARYLTTEWCTVDTAIAELAEAWRVVQAVTDGTMPVNRQPSASLPVVPERLIAQAAGCLVAAANASGVCDEDVLRMCWEAIEKKRELAARLPAPEFADATPF